MRAGRMGILGAIISFTLFQFQNITNVGNVHNIHRGWSHPNFLIRYSDSCMAWHDLVDIPGTNQCDKLRKICCRWHNLGSGHAKSNLIL